jgi:alpha,alpha-trehalase
MSYEPIHQYIRDYWPSLIRSNPTEKGTLIGLPRPYVVPAQPTGNAMFQEMYYWDSYFIMLGLIDTEHEPLILDMIENMAYLLERFGVIPNGSRYYFLSRSQPPFFMEMVWLGYEIKQRRKDTDALEYLRRMTVLAEQEHVTVWQGTQQPHHRLVYRGLSRYFEINYLDILASCECGWDHSTRCDHRWLDHLPVDLNAILYKRERRFAQVAALLGDEAAAHRWQEAAAAREQTMHELMWDDAQGIFSDYDYVHQHRTDHPSLAAFFPLWAGCATPAQAAALVERWLPRFEQAGGLVTTLQAEAGMQWAWPNGWANLHWIVVEGLAAYGYDDHAERLRRKWCETCALVFQRTGAMWEKYNVVEPGGEDEGGLYGSVMGFGWTNSVFTDFARKLPATG